MRTRRTAALFLALASLCSSAAAGGPDAGRGEPAPIETTFDVPTEKCSALTAEKSYDIRTSLAKVPSDPHTVEGADLVDRRKVTNELRHIVAALRACERVQHDAVVSHIVAGAPTQLTMKPGRGPARLRYDLAHSYGFEDPAQRARGQREADAQDQASSAAGLQAYVEKQLATFEKIYADTEAWAAADDVAIDEEQRCLTTSGCIAKRVADRAKKASDEALIAVCLDVQKREADVRDMSRERANPSGYVDKVLLHSLGEDIQEIDARLPASKAAYAAIAHKPASCVGVKIAWGVPGQPGGPPQ